MNASAMNTTSVRRLAAAAIVALWLTVPAAGDDAERAPANGALDEATLEALGIREETAATTAATTPVAPHAGSWSWPSGVYRYDPSGNITKIGEKQSFVYDLQGRLVKAQLARQDYPDVQLQREYTYDAYGNMLSETTDTTTVQMPTTTATNHLTGMSATYDAAGNLTQFQPPGETNLYQYKYDPLNALQEVKAANVTGQPRELHIYTASDERIWTYDLGTDVSHWKIRDLGGKVLRDYKVTGTTWQVWRDYVYRDGLLLAAVTPTNTLYFSLDHLGTPRVITDGNRELKGFHHYHPFGQEWTDSSGAQEGEVMKFTGHERDPNPAASTDGLDYMHARYYSSKVGRFLSVDPVLGNLLQPQSWNRYAYVFNNPTNFIDPTGLATWKPTNDPCPKNAPEPCFTYIAQETERERELRERAERMRLIMLVIALGFDSTMNRAARIVCGAIPSGRTTGVSGAIGSVGGLTGGGELVLNYNSGKVSGFGFGGIQTIGWNGVLSGSVYSGYVWGLQPDNGNYKGGFTGVNAAGTAGGFLTSSSDGLTGSPRGVAPTWDVWAAGASAGGALVGGVTFGASVTNYTPPLQLGRYWAMQPSDAVIMSVRQVLCQ